MLLLILSFKPEFFESQLLLYFRQVLMVTKPHMCLFSMSPFRHPHTPHL